MSLRFNFRPGSTTPRCESKKRGKKIKRSNPGGADDKKKEENADYTTKRP